MTIHRRNLFLRLAISTALATGAFAISGSPVTAALVFGFTFIGQ